MKILISSLTLMLSMANVLAANIVVVQKDKAFDKTEISVNAGDTVTFRNEEKDITHNVYSLGPKNDFELKVQEPGSSSDVTLNEAGDTDVECAIHPGMKLKVHVKKK